MTTPTIETVNENILKLRDEIASIKRFVEEDFELNDDVVEEVDESRRRNEKEFISQEEMKEEFLSDDSD